MSVMRLCLYVSFIGARVTVILRTPARTLLLPTTTTTTSYESTTTYLGPTTSTTVLQYY